MRAAKGYFILKIRGFDSVTSRERMPNDRVLGPYRSRVVNDNSERILNLCRQSRAEDSGNMVEEKIHM